MPTNKREKCSKGLKEEAAQKDGFLNRSPLTPIPFAERQGKDRYKILE